LKLDIFINLVLKLDVKFHYKKMNNAPVFLRKYNPDRCSVELYFSCYFWYLIVEEYNKLICSNQVKPKLFVIQETSDYIQDICEILETNSWAELSVLSFEMASPNDRHVIDVIDVFLEKLLVEKNCDCKSFIYS
jgi:hypothetical protein